ncbi:PH domain-containing protein [soil metagenome]
MPAQPASELPPPEEVEAEGLKLKPSAVPIWFLYDVGRGIFGLIPLFFAGPAAIPFAAALGLILLIAPAVKYSRFRYDIRGNTLVVQGGLISRWRRVIPRERVQSVDLVQKLRHRAFGVVELRIEAVGGKQTEAALVALAPEEADRIRSWASGGAVDSAVAAQQVQAPPLAHLTGKDLLIAGITGGRVAVLAALIGYSQEYFGENSFDQITGYGERLLPGASLVIIISALAAVVIAVSLLLSIALTILIYWDFTVRLEEDRLIITRGLLEKRRAQIPLHRVQAISVNENFIRRPLKLASLSVVVAGYSSEGQENQESTVLLPLAPRATAWRVATDVLGASPELASVDLEAPPARSLARRVIVPSVLGLGSGVAGTLMLGLQGAAAFGIVPLAWLMSWLSWRSLGYALDPGYVLVRGGVFVRKTSVVPDANIQHLQLTWSIFQRWFRLATVRVHIPGTHRSASDLDSSQASRWFRLLSERAA